MYSNGVVVIVSFVMQVIWECYMPGIFFSFFASELAVNLSELGIFQFAKNLSVH